MPTIEANLTDGRGRYALIVSRFNDFITSRLQAGAEDTLIRHGVAKDQITTIWVPGAFELPQVARRVADKGGFDAIIALGCVIRGSTPHFDYVAGEAAKGLSHVAQNTDAAVVFGVLTTQTIEQAIERAGTKMGNKGAEAAMAAIEMVALNRVLDAQLSGSEG